MTLLKLKPGAVSLSQLNQLYQDDCKISLDGNCRDQVEAAAEIVRQAAEADEAVYGVNTGFGKLANTRIAADKTTELQRNLILSHCCGVGEPLSPGIVRLVIVLKLLSLGRGASGVRWEVIKLLESMLNKGIVPVIPGQGSVGASGDLAPLAHLTAVMIGEGTATYRGNTDTGANILHQAGLVPIELGPKEGLGMINGTQVSTALALAGLFDSWNLALTSIITGALSSDAVMASTTPFHPQIHQLRGMPGQIEVAAVLCELLRDSEIRAAHAHRDDRVQDPYCLRCQPQVLGACLDFLRQAARTLAIEANAVTDNPLVIVDQQAILSGGNFHAEPVAFAADQCAIAIAEIGSICERRIATTVDPAQNHGLPAFLASDPGLHCGFMIAEVTAAALMSENKQKAMPCSVDSTPTSANQEDHVSMACHGARRLLAMNQNLANIIAIEALTGAQGVECRLPLTTSQPLRNAIKCIRQEVDPLDHDRFMADDLANSANLVREGKLLEAVSSVELPPLICRI